MYGSRRMSRQGIVHSLTEKGIARLIFDEKRTTFEGTMETYSGETISLRGRKPESPAEEESGSDGSRIMDIVIVDGEAGTSYFLNCVMVSLEEHNHITIKNPALNFTTDERMIGIKADVEIRKFLRPNLTNISRELFVGPMQVHVIASQKPQQSRRKESICDTDVKILEESDDFLA